MVTNIINRLKLKDRWVRVDLGKFNDFFLIAIKDEKYKKDTIDVNSVKKIRFEVGIDSGIKDKPLTIQYINLDFNDLTSGDNEINRITAFTKQMNFPNEFYLKAVSVDDGFKTITSGETSISININAVNLGR